MATLKEIKRYPDTNSVEATWVDGEVVVKCHSYDQVQMDMLATDLGADLPEYQWIIDEVNANFIPVPPPPALPDVKAAAAAQIDLAAGTTRSKYITTAAGQEATYTEKARQCEAYKAAGYPATPDPVGHAYVIAEANAKSCGYREACDAILTERDQWAVLGAAIEQSRRAAKISIAAATTAEEVDVALQTGLAELTAL